MFIVFYSDSSSRVAVSGEVSEVSVCYSLCSCMTAETRAPARQTVTHCRPASLHALIHCCSLRRYYSKTFTTVWLRNMSERETFLDVIVAINKGLLSDAFPVESLYHIIMTNEVYVLYASINRHEDLSKSLLLNSKREGKSYGKNMMTLSSLSELSV